MKTPKELDTITDVVLSYRPKPKSKAAKRRKRKTQRKKKDSGGSFADEPDIGVGWGT